MNTLPALKVGIALAAAASRAPLWAENSPEPLGPAPFGGTVLSRGEPQGGSQMAGPGRLVFEANRGQVPSAVAFVARASGYDLFLTPSEAVLSLRRPIRPAGA